MPKPKKPVPRWFVRMPGDAGVEVSAWTCSEARGVVKKLLKQTRRLPIGTTLKRLPAA